MERHAQTNPVYSQSSADRAGRTSDAEESIWREDAGAVLESTADGGQVISVYFFARCLGAVLYIR